MCCHSNAERSLNTKRDRLIPDTCHKIDGETITGKIIEIGSSKHLDFIYGGTVLDDCEIRILCGARSVHIFNATIRNSIIKPRRELKNLQLLDVHFDNCKFFGKYSGCRFGQLTSKNIGTIKNCDFSAARLDLCDFYPGSDIDSLTFPAWPHIVVREPNQWRNEWLEIPFPNDFRITQEVIVDPEMIPCEAIAIYLPSDCADCGTIRSLLATKKRILIKEGV